jgi:RNA polymerase sigma-70 factor (ECF subfamily)
VKADVPSSPSVELSTIGLPSLSDRFEAFVLRHQDLVFGTAVRLLGSRSEAEDVAQIVFLKAFQRFDQLEQNLAAGGWLRTVTRNACLNHLQRYRSRWRFFSELRSPQGSADRSVHESNAVDAVVDPSASPLAALETAEAQQRLETALEQLPDHQRVPLVLFHFEQMSYEEIARTLNVGLGKVKTDIHRARLALRVVLE